MGNNRIIEAYMDMVLNGIAFSNWKHKTDRDTRQRIVEFFMDIKKKSSFSLDMSSIKKVSNMRELDSLMEQWEIKDDDFKV